MSSPNRCKLKRGFFLHDLHRCFVPKFLDFPLVVEPLPEFFKAFLKGLLGVVPAIVNPLVKQGLEQPLDLPILPRATGIYLVVEDELCL